MTGKRLDRTLARVLGMCALVASFGMADDAHARTRIRRYTPAAPAAGQCMVNYANITDQVSYAGGPVLSNVQAVPVFWTSAVNSTIQAWAQNYLETLVNSAYMDLLAQYSTTGQSGGTGQTIGHGTATAPVTITPMMATGSTVMDSAIGPELEAQIKAMHLPAPTKDAHGYSNVLYVLFFPKSIIVNDGTGSACTSWCGYHGAYGGTSSMQELTYAVIPDMSTGTGCDTGCASQCRSGDPDISAGTTSHEVAEAISDPANAAAWVNPNNSSMNSEIGDICTGNGGTQEDMAQVPGTNIIAQYEWSQQDKKCLVAPAGSSSSSGSSSGSGADGGSSTSSGSSSGSTSGTSGSSSGSDDGGSGTSSGSTSGGSSGSSSGSTSGSSGSGSGSGGTSSGGTSGSTSSSGNGSGGTSGSGSTSGSSGAGRDAGDGFGDMPTSANNGCGCAMPGRSANGAGLAALAGLVLIGAVRRSRRT